MDLRKVLATLGILAYVWPAVFFLAFIPFFTVDHHLDLLGGHRPLAVLAILMVIFVCGATATWASIWVFRRAFRKDSEPGR